MKKIIINVFLILGLLSCKAQSVYPLDVEPEDIHPNLFGSYVKDIDNHYNDIVGLWKWEDGADFFELNLEKFTKYSNAGAPRRYRDKIFGKYKYVQAGATVAELTDITPPLIRMSLHYHTPTEYSVFIEDVSTGAYKVGLLTITSPNHATIDLWDSRGLKYVDDINNIPVFTLPTHLELIRI
jgi:hypothetical protein